MKKATLRFKTGEAASHAVKAALSPESEREVQRTNVAVEVEKDWVILNVQAEDTTALRAAVNSYVRWMQIALDTAKLTDK